MLTLLSDLHFWTSEDDIIIKDTDYGAFKFYERKENVLSEHSQSKKMYAEKRDFVWNLTNKRPKKLKDKLKEFEELLSQNRIVYCKWTDNSILQFMLSTGIIINIYVNIHTGEPQKISFDKYLVGKLHSEYVSDVVITRSNILCTYNDSQITIVNFIKPTYNQSITEKIIRLEPKIQVAELAGPNGRKLERKMSSNITEDKLLVWWRCTRDEVYPWSPLVKDQDRANIHIYNLSGLKLELICYRRTEFDPIGITFSTVQPNIIHCVEQKVSRKGVVTVETCTYEIIRNKLQQVLITSIPLQTHVCCHSFSPDNEKLMLGCIDGSIVLFDQGRGVTHLVKAAFIPTIISWHLDGAVILVANEKSQIQFFDVSLACIKSQTSSEDSASSNVLDLTSYFKIQPTLLQMIWGKKPQVPYMHDRYLQTDGLLLLMFENGPIAILRLFSGCGARGDIHTPGLTADVLITQYILQNQVDRAIGVILSLNWDMYGASCLISLHKIMGHLFKQRLTPESEAQIQRALGSFYAPLQPISEAVHSEYGEQVKDLTRKFFHLLVRYRLYEKAFCLAIDINDYDLFMDLYYCAQVINNEEMANAALSRAKDLIQRSNSSNSNHSLCSRSSCSQCSESDSTHSNQNEDWTGPEEPTSAPPLPIPQAATSVPIQPPPMPVYAPPLPTLSNRSLNIPPFPTVRKLPTQSSFYHPPQIKFTDTIVDIPKIPPPQFSVPFPTPRIAKNPEILRPKVIQQETAGIQSAFKLIDHSLKLKTPAMERNDVYAPPKLFQMYGTTTSSSSSSNQNSVFSTIPSPPKEIVHKTISMNIPPVPSLTNSSVYKTTPNLFRTSAPLKLSVPLQCGSGSNNNSPNKATGEKNVKFSDTVTAFIVPEIPRSEKPSSVKDKPKRSSNHYLTDPKQELADSLPLCHPNDEYLKDFTPITTNAESDSETGAKIKVVHFGMV